MNLINDYPVLAAWLTYTLGVFTHLFVVKIPGAKKRDMSSNTPFSFKDYWSKDKFPILGNICIMLILTLAWSEFTKLQPSVADYRLLIFALLGFVGNSVVLAWLSKYTGQQNEVINVKSNTSDLMTGNHSADLQKITERAAAVTGKPDIANVQIEIKRDPEAQ